MTRDRKVGLPKIHGGGLPNLGKKSQWACVAFFGELSDPDGEKAAFFFDSKLKALERKDQIFAEGVKISTVSKDILVYYPASQVKKVIVQKEGAKLEGSKFGDEKKGVVH